jgi:MacB-like protein
MRSISSGYSMLAITCKRPPQRTHCSISMPNTRFKRRAQFSATCFGIGRSGSLAAVVDIGVAQGLLAAVAPAVFAARSSLAGLLASSGLRGGGGQTRLRRGMIVAQVALSLVLLNSGALVVRSFDRLLKADPAFRPEGVFTVLVRTPPAFFPNDEVVAFHDRVSNALASVPGVTRVGGAGALPLGATTYASATPISIADAPGNTGDPERDAVLTDLIRARAGYFEVMGMRLVAGRTFTESPGEAREAVIDTAFARRFFPGANPLGARIGDRTVVGVVGQARLYDLYRDGRPHSTCRTCPTRSNARCTTCSRRRATPMRCCRRCGRRSAASTRASPWARRVRWSRSSPTRCVSSERGRR